MPDTHLSLPASPPKRRRHGRRFKKRVAELAAAAAVVPGGLGSSSAGPVGFLSVAGLAGSSELAAAASAPSENLVRNRIEFCDLG